VVASSGVLVHKACFDVLHSALLDEPFLEFPLLVRVEKAQTRHFCLRLVYVLLRISNTILIIHEAAFRVLQVAAASNVGVV
jgi:hypothetical protein